MSTDPSTGASIERVRRLAHQARHGTSPERVAAARRARLRARKDLDVVPVDSPARITRAFTYVLDDLIRVPGTDFRFGVDPLLSIIPAAGTAMGAALGTVVIADAIRLRAPVPVVARMLGNYVINWLAGLVPVIGPFLDAAWRSNRRNLRLLNRTIAERDQVRRASVIYWITVGVMFTVIVGLVIAIPIGLLVWLNSVIGF